MSTSSADSARSAFRRQSRACAALGSPFMGRLMNLCADRMQPDGPVTQRVLHWPGAVGPEAASVPLRLAGALHALVLERLDPALAAAYPPHSVPDDTLWEAVRAALTTHETRILTWLDSAPQTNEVRRGAALIPALHMVSRTTGLPLALVELGCSGGLNLRCDRFHLRAGTQDYGPADSAVTLQPNWTGPAPAAAPDMQVADRRGVDLSPLDPQDADDRLRLLAYLWADQPARMAATQAAIALSRDLPATLIAGDAAARLPGLIAPRPGTARVVFHTVAWQYFPEDAKAAATRALNAAGSAATTDSPLARIGMEWDGDDGAALTLTLWPGGQTHTLARVDFHGRWLRWTGPTAL